MTARHQFLISYGFFVAFFSGILMFWGYSNELQDFGISMQWYNGFTGVGLCFGVVSLISGLLGFVPKKSAQLELS